MTIAAMIIVPIVALFGPVLTLFALPGNWLTLVVAGLFEWGTEGRLFSTTTIACVVCLAVAGEIWEFVASASRAKKAGAERRGSIGALVGGIVGAIVGTGVMPLVGTLIGGGLGALAGSFAMERSGGRDVGEALKIGKAAAAGQMLGVAGKFCVAVVIWAWVTLGVWL